MLQIYKIMPYDDFSELYAEILEKMIDSQEDNTRALTSLIETNKEMRADISRNQQEIKDIKTFFTNGFRLELKKYIKDEHEESRKRTLEMEKKINKIHNMITKPGFWAKLFMGLVIALSGAAVAVAKIVEVM